MHKRKEDLSKFWVWMRNGTAFGTTWLLILILIYSFIHNIPAISTNVLMKLILWIIGGVFLFNTFFTCLFIKKWNFIKRLTGFMLAISLYECFGFYLLGFIERSGTVSEWLIFVGIVLALYFCSIAIYQPYSKKKGEIYTKSLHEYQQKRNIEIKEKL